MNNLCVCVFNARCRGIKVAVTLLSQLAGKRLVGKHLREGQQLVNATQLPAYIHIYIYIFIYYTLTSKQLSALAITFADNN